MRHWPFWAGIIMLLIAAVSYEVILPVSAATKLYLTTVSPSDKVQRSDVDGSNIEDLIDYGVATNNMRGIAVDSTNGKIYWTDVGIDKIQRADLDGSNAEDLLTGLANPYGIALDVASGKMYWIEQTNDRVRRADLDGSNAEDLITSGLSDPRGIALDIAAGKMYLTDFVSTQAFIKQADLDGTNLTTLVTTAGTHEDVALDIANGKMYWTDSELDKVQRADLDGSNVEDLITTGSTFPWGIEIDTTNNKMLWSDFFGGKIERADLDGSNREDFLTSTTSWGFSFGIDAVAVAESSTVSSSTGGASGGGGGAGTSAASSSITLDQAVRDQKTGGRVVTTTTGDTLVFSTKIPDADQVKDVTITVFGNSYTMRAGDTPGAFSVRVAVPQIAGAYTYKLEADYGSFPLRDIGTIIVNQGPRSIGELLPFINRLYRQVYNTNPTFAQWSYWANRIIAGDKTTLPDLFGAIQWQQLFGEQD